MHLRFGCEGCGATAEAAVPDGGGEAACAACGRARTVADPARFAPGGRPERCALCPGDDLYLQRDFPWRAGLTVMAAGAAAFLLLAGLGRPALGFAVLGAIALADLVLFRALPVVTVCYRCGAELRGAGVNPDHTGFDHHAAETAAKRAAVDRAERTEARAAPAGARHGG